MTAEVSGIRAPGLPPLLRAVAGRVLSAAVLLLVVSVLVFLLLYLAPGDLVKNLVGVRNVTPETIAAIREQYRLDDPLWVRYGAWLEAAIRGDFGTSVRNQTPVVALLAGRAGVTLAIAGIAFALAIVVSVPLGILSAVREGTATDRVVSIAAIVGVSAPSFAVAILLLSVFALALGWFPLYGAGSGGLDTAWHLILPSITIAIGLSAIIVKLTRTTVARELRADYIIAARARGLSPRATLGLALRNAAIPIVTGAGLLLAFLVGGTVFVETVFAIPGWGTTLQDAVLFKDVPVVQALSLVIATAIVAAAVLADLAGLALDPRMRPRRRTR